MQVKPYSPNRTAWDAALVRVELPRVRAVITSGRDTIYHWARITGRLNQFATVTIDHTTAELPYRDRMIGPSSPLQLDRTVSWETLADCLNNDRAVIMD